MSLNICSAFAHDEIVFDGKRCPLCEALERIDQLKDEMADTLKDAERVEAELSEAQEQIERLESDLADHAFCGGDNK